MRGWHKLTATALKAALAGRAPNALPPLDLSSGTPFQQRVWAELRKIGPGETLTIYPSDWLDLESAEVIVEREGGDGGFDMMLLALMIGVLVVAAAVIWFLVVRRKKKG